MELIERYVYAVTQKLPEAQRTDIEKELNGLIEDMLEERMHGGEPTKKDVEEVLLKLGNPRELADKYRGNKRYLIGPELFHIYVLVLKISLISIGLTMCGIFAIETMLTPEDVYVNLSRNFLNGILGCVSGFGWVTAIFAIIEYYRIHNGNTSLQSSHQWKISELPPLPNHRTNMKRFESIFSIVFILLAGVFLTFSVDYFGVWVFQDDGPTTVVPFFDKVVFRDFLPLMWIVFAIGILKDCMKLIVGKWTLKLATFELVVYIAYFVLALFMFTNMTIWNSEFMQQLAESGLTPLGSDGYDTMSTIWDQITDYLIYLIALVFVIQVVVSIHRMVKLNKMAK